MAIKKLGNKKYFIRVTKYINSKKRERKFTGEFVTMGAVREKEQALIDELLSIKEYEENEAIRYTWKKALADYLEYSEENHRLTTFYNRKKILEAYTFQWNDLELDKIAKNMISILINELDYSVSYKQSLLKYIRCVFEVAIDNRKTLINPAKKIKIHADKNSREKANKLEAMSKSEVFKVLSYMNKLEHNHYDIFFVTYMLGLRSSEAVALEFKDIDFDQMKVTISKSWCKKKKGFVPPKNGTSRIVPVNETLLPILNKLKQIDRGNDFVLPRIKSWINGGATKVLKKVQQELGIRETNYHSLRASFITHLLLAGVSIVKVQQLVGHAELKTTMRYVRLCGSDLDGGTESLNFDSPISVSNVIKLVRS